MASAVLSKRTDPAKPAPKKVVLPQELPPDSVPPGKPKPKSTTWENSKNSTKANQSSPSTKVKTPPTVLPSPVISTCELDSLEFDTTALKAFWPNDGSLSDPKAVGSAAESLYNTGGKMLLLESLAAIANELQSLTAFCDAEQAKISELEQQAQIYASQAESYASQAQQATQEAELMRNALKKRIRSDLKD